MGSWKNYLEAWWEKRKEKADVWLKFAKIRRKKKSSNIQIKKVWSRISLSFRVTGLQARLVKESCSVPSKVWGWETLQGGRSWTWPPKHEDKKGGAHGRRRSQGRRRAQRQRRRGGGWRTTDEAFTLLPSLGRVWQGKGQRRIRVSGVGSHTKFGFTLDNWVKFKKEAWGSVCSCRAGEAPWIRVWRKRVVPQVVGLYSGKEGEKLEK